MQSNQPGSQQQCPLCQQANYCKVVDGVNCWCHQQYVAPELLARVTSTGRQQCICAACLAAFNQQVQKSD